MPATPARIALSLNDGVVLSKSDPTLKTDFPNATDAATNEMEMFFDSSVDALVLLGERWDFQSTPGRPREQVELDSSFGLGTTIPLTPAAPVFVLTDDVRGIVAAPCIARAYSIDYGSERYAIEVIGTIQTGAARAIVISAGGYMLLETDTDGTSRVLLE